MDHLVSYARLAGSTPAPATSGMTGYRRVGLVCVGDNRLQKDTDSKG